MESVHCCHDNKYCEPCKTRAVKVIIGGSTVVCSLVFGSLGPLDRILIIVLQEFMI